MVQKASNLLLSGLLIAALPIIAHADTVTLFSSGFTIPETITPVPSGFGTVGGDLMVPYKGPNALYVVLAGGGAPVLFASGVSGNGEVFLPSSFTSFGGDLLVTSELSGPGIIAVNSTGGQTVVPLPSSDAVTGGAVVAPAGFGSVAGDALIGARMAQALTTARSLL